MSRTAVTVAFLALLFSDVAAYGCSCVRMDDGKPPRLSNGEAAPRASEVETPGLVVLLAKAVAVKAKPSGDPKADEYFPKGSITTFKVSRSWNETVGATVDVESGFPGGGCGWVFKVGTEYVIFATRDKNGTLTTNICTRTTSTNDAPDLVENIVRVAGKGNRLARANRHGRQR
jgi:hypothetical protein